MTRIVDDVRVDWTSSLLALLSRVGLGKGLSLGEGDGKARQGVHAGALKGEAGAGEGEGTARLRGHVLDAEGVLLSGLGYAGDDRTNAAKNLAEQANVDRFLARADTLERGDTANQAGGILKDNAAEARAREARGLLDDPAGKAADGVRRAEAAGVELRSEAERPRLAVREPTPEERREGERDEGGREGGHGQRDSDGQGEGGDDHRQGDESPKQLQFLPGDLGPARSGLDADDGRNAEGLRSADVLGSVHRCRGEHADGGRCLRKPVPGTPYCREHAASYK
ncbi:MAG: hypothetical protein H6729_01520 [Deltaproteobacteria bacterium]|nr:hypothetical protein [Deltaproteobacteria bacterium]